jgi:hypothetical protein
MMKPQSFAGKKASNAKPPGPVGPRSTLSYINNHLSFPSSENHSKVLVVIPSGVEFVKPSLSECDFASLISLMATRRKTRRKLWSKASLPEPSMKKMDEKVVLWRRANSTAS